MEKQKILPLENDQSMEKQGKSQEIFRELAHREIDSHCPEVDVRKISARVLK